VFVISTCGRANASSGTKGSYDLVDKSTSKVIRQVYWNCPWGTKTNLFTLEGNNKDWITEHQGANISSGALGNVTVTVFKKN
jgi:Aegerolysin